MHRLLQEQALSLPLHTHAPVASWQALLGMLVCASSRGAHASIMRQATSGHMHVHERMIAADCERSDTQAVSS